MSWTGTEPAAAMGRQKAQFITNNPLLADRLRGTQAYNEAFVEQCYLRYLQRAPDTDGFRFWVEKLNGRLPHATMATTTR